MVVGAGALDLNASQCHIPLQTILQTTRHNQIQSQRQSGKREEVKCYD
jgi:hypothetical protein